MHDVWRMKVVALAAALACWGQMSAANAQGRVNPAPYSLDRSVIMEHTPVDPTPIERHYYGWVPPCEDSWALTRINAFFAETERSFWASPLRIQGYEKIREIAYRPWGYAKIPRRYCEAVALISDGKPRTIYYSLIEDGGFAGMGSGVEWCVQGLDRSWTYAPDCQMARP
ncbi:hypothetical protein [Blastochloris tepida]|jgi:hypothetical protein|uniref:Uncharacterized protein n=1 Tax=Blastochloris tepida TaxID=2233851 RepID=A0A348FWN5_9HYPH|nr:hypothetical protein [Blastochloris tepida]BBF91718.1 hypothetical protein BLTE_04030 [Blastochloris tepida]